MTDSYRQIMEESWEANIQLSQSGLVVHTFGNVSCFDSDKGVFAIKPSCVPYDKLKVEDMVVVDLDAIVVNGSMRPSSDTKTHAVLYKQFKEIRGICHTHSRYASSWAQAVKPIPVFGTTHADHLTQDVPCTKVMSDEAIKGDYETETGYQIIDAFKNISPKEVEMVLVASHGPFTWGSSPQKAVYNSVILEEIAQIAAYTLAINPDAKRLKSTLIDKHYFRKHGKHSYYGQK